MAYRGSSRGCLSTTAFILVLLVPVVGHIILTFMILDDNYSLGEKILWIAFVWMVPIIGPLIYLLIGQRQNRVLGPAMT